MGSPSTNNNQQANRLGTRHAHYLFVACLIAAPLAFGSVETWSIRIVEIISLTALVLLLAKKFMRQGRLFAAPGAIPLMMLLAYILLQCLPLPQFILKAISPATFKAYSETLLIAKPDAWLPISLNVTATLDEFLRFSSYAAIYFVSIQTLARSKRLKDTALLIAWFAAAVAFIGILSKVAGNGLVMWIRQNPWHTADMGPYINRNHFAGLMAMLLPLIFSLFVAYRPKTGQGSISQLANSIFLHPSFNLHILLAMAFTLVAISILLSMSRAGLIAASAGTLCFGLLYFRHDRKVGFVLLTFSLIAAVAYGWFGWTPIIERFEHLATGPVMSQSTRLMMWQDTLNMLKDYPVFGTGFGTYMQAYPSYRTLPRAAVIGHAHNDYLEFLAAGGMVGALLLLAFTSAVLWHALRSLLHRKDRYAICLCAGGISGLIASLIHNSVEFNMQVGANGLYFFALAGLTVSAASTRHLGKSIQKSYLAKYASGRLVQTLLSASGALLCILIIESGAGMTAGYLHKKAVASKPHDKARLIKASALAPLNLNYRLSAGLASMDSLEFDQAVSEAISALRLSPLDGRSLMLLASLKYINGDSVKAESLYKAATKYSLRVHKTPLAQASWLLSQGRTEDALDVARAAMAREPHDADTYIAVLLAKGVHAEDIKRSIPPSRTYPFIALAGRLAGSDAAMTVPLLDSALSATASDSEVEPSDFLKLFEMHISLGDNEKALSTMRVASNTFPDVAVIRLTLAKQYEQMGILYRAREEYSAAASLDGTDAQAAEGLKRLEKSGGR